MSSEGRPTMGDRRIVTDGPFAETKDLVAGHVLIRVGIRAATLGWSRRLPKPAGQGREAEIEVRQPFELDRLGPSDAADRHRALWDRSSGREPCRA